SSGISWSNALSAAARNAQEAWAQVNRRAPDGQTILSSARLKKTRSRDGQANLPAQLVARLRSLGAPPELRKGRRGAARDSRRDQPSGEGARGLPGRPAVPAPAARAPFVGERSGSALGAAGGVPAARQGDGAGDGKRLPRRVDDQRRAHVRRQMARSA